MKAPPKTITCVRCKREVFHLAARFTYEGPYCHSCWVQRRKGLYEQGTGTQRVRYKDGGQRP